ncbi:MAG: hypothetical protein MZV63_23420 [Marinilabiliales bacterium]|nr:hypothetical protein [Marinilabiliales bacterium]
MLSASGPPSLHDPVALHEGLVVAHVRLKVSRVILADDPVEETSSLLAPARDERCCRQVKASPPDTCPHGQTSWDIPFR